MTRILRGAMLEDEVMVVIIFGLIYRRERGVRNSFSSILARSAVKCSTGTVGAAFAGKELSRARVRGRRSRLLPVRSHAKAGVRDAAVFSQIQIPLECFFRQAVFVNALQ